MDNILTRLAEHPFSSDVIVQISSKYVATVEEQAAVKRHRARFLLMLKHETAVRTELPLLSRASPKCHNLGRTVSVRSHRHRSPDLWSRRFTVGRRQTEAYLGCKISNTFQGLISPRTGLTSWVCGCGLRCLAMQFVKGWPTPIWPSARSMPRKTAEVAKATTQMSSAKSYKASITPPDRECTDSGRVPQSPSMVLSGSQKSYCASSSNTLCLVSLSYGTRFRASRASLDGT